MPERPLHQVLAGAVAGDAVTDQALLLQRWLREWGFASEVYAEHVDADLAAQIRPLTSYRPRRDEELVVYHHSIGSAAVEFLRSAGPRLLLIYHNVTPALYLANVDPARAQRAILGREQLAQLQPLTRLALADSEYNARELDAAGFGATGVLPITLDEGRYQLPPNASPQHLNTGPEKRLLFVGRIAPNKRQEDLIKILYYLQRLRSDVHLYLVGDLWLPAYGQWLDDLAEDLGLTAKVTLTGRVSHADLLAYYQAADLYLSMSEHEGFGKPLIESMYLGLPVVAYAAAAIPDTLATAGVLVKKKDFPLLAELLNLLLEDDALQAQLVRRGHERAQDFLEPRVKQTWQSYLEALNYS